MKPTVYFDLDGVLADFVRGAFALHRRSVPMAEVRWDFPRQIGFGEREAEFWEPLGYGFWSNLPPSADGFALLREVEKRVGPNRIGLVSSPCDTRGCCDGKRDWVGKYLPGYKKRLFLGSAKEIFAGHDKILFDDHDANVEKFIHAGGRALLVPRPWNDLRASCDADGRFDPAALAKTLDLVGVA